MWLSCHFCCELPIWSLVTCPFCPNSWWLKVTSEFLKFWYLPYSKHRFRRYTHIYIFIQYTVYIYVYIITVYIGISMTMAFYVCSSITSLNRAFQKRHGSRRPVPLASACPVVSLMTTSRPRPCGALRPCGSSWSSWCWLIEQITGVLQGSMRVVEICWDNNQSWDFAVCFCFNSNLNDCYSSCWSWGLKIIKHIIVSYEVNEANAFIQ